METSSHPSGKRWTSQNLMKHLCRDLKTNGSDPTRQSLVIVGYGESPRFFGFFFSIKLQETNKLKSERV